MVDVSLFIRIDNAIKAHSRLSPASKTFLTQVNALLANLEPIGNESDELRASRPVPLQTTLDDISHASQGPNYLSVTEWCSYFQESGAPKDSFLALLTTWNIPLLDQAPPLVPAAPPPVVASGGALQSSSLSAQSLKAFIIVAKVGHGSFPLGEVCRSTWNDESLWEGLLQAPSSPSFETTEHAPAQVLIHTTDSIKGYMADSNDFTTDEENSDSSSEEQVSFTDNRSLPSKAKEWRIYISKVRYHLHDDDYGSDNYDFNYQTEISHPEIPEGSRWLLAASACGHTARVAWLCRLYPPESALDGALLLAAFYGHVETIGALIAAGANVDASRAILPKRFHHLSLFDYSYDYEQQQMKGPNITPLLVAISFGNLSIVQQLISLGADTVQAANAAAFFGDVNVLSAVLDTGINIDAISFFPNTGYHKREGTPLCSALYSHELSDEKALHVVNLLLARGAKPWVGKTVANVDKHNESTLELAFRRKNVDIFRSLVDATIAGGDSSYAAATSAVERLSLQSLLVIDRTQYSMFEQQHFGGLHNILLDAVKYLVSCGADVKAASCALEAAAAMGRSDIVKALIDAGADVKAASCALNAAAATGRSDIVKALIDAGAEINASISGTIGNEKSWFFDKWGKKESRFSALCESVISCQVDTVQLLLTSGARPWIRCDDNDPSPLIRAVQLVAEKKDRREDRATFIPKFFNLTLARALDPASEDSFVAIEELCLFLNAILSFTWEGPSRELVCDSVSRIARSVANGSFANPKICAGTLCASVWMSRLDLVSLLLDSNAAKTDVNSISEYKHKGSSYDEIRHDGSPLSWAIKVDNADIIRLLLSRGALPLGTSEISIHNFLGGGWRFGPVNPFYFAMHLGRCDLLKIIVDSAITGIQAKETRSIIYENVQGGYEIDQQSKRDQEKYRDVLDVLFDAMVTDVCKSTSVVTVGALPFMFAAYFGRSDAIERLFNAGVDVNAQLIVQLPCHVDENTKVSNIRGHPIDRTHKCSAIDAAIAEGRIDVVSSLLALGARPCLAKKILSPLARFKNMCLAETWGSSSTPLHFYMSNRNAEMMKLLLSAAERCDDLQLHDKNAEIAKRMQLPTLLDMIVRERIEFSRERTIKNEQIITSHIACENCIIDAAVRLLARSAPAAVLGENALAAFALADREDAIKLMIIAGVNAQSSESLTALKVSIDAGSVKAVRMLIENNVASPMSSISDNFFEILEGALRYGQNNKFLALMASVADARPPLELVLAVMDKLRSIKCLKGVLTEYGQFTASETVPLGSLLRSAALRGFANEVRLLVDLGVDLSDREPIASGGANFFGTNVSPETLQRWERYEERSDSRRTQNSTALILAVRGLASMSIGCSSSLDEGSEIDRMQGYVDTVRSLVTAGADINAADVFGINALCEARRGRDNAWARAVEGAERNREGLLYDRDREAFSGRRGSGSSDGRMSISSRRSFYRPHKAGYALQKAFDEILVILGDTTIRGSFGGSRGAPDEPPAPPCYSCGEMGHRSFDCPSKQGGGGGGRRY